MSTETIHRSTSFIIGIILFSSVLIWSLGFFYSPFFKPAASDMTPSLPDDSDSREEYRLADAYWMRYRDVNEDRYYGRDGLRGINGARLHFEQHGTHENRIFSPLPIATEPDLERELAKAYWKRYPDIEKHPIWGRNGHLGIRGPRDHYVHRGRDQGRVWGLTSAPGEGDTPPNQ